MQSLRSNEITLILAFSGGGTRAAALAYGALTALRDTTITISGQPRRLLDEVDVISSVSGGSFTAAYFGLHGDRTFIDFEKKFLRHNIEKQLLHGLFNPGFWFSSHGRTEMAMDYYDDRVFKGATFADLQRKDGPLIVINAMTDIQLHRNNAATLELLQQSIKRWAGEVSAPGRRVEPYFIEVDFKKVSKPEKRRFFNQIPTSLPLGKEQVDDLIAVGRELLLGSDEFRRFINDLGRRLTHGSIDQIC